MAHEPPSPPERLQKRIAELGLASRREAEEWIRAGRLSVNGVVATLGVRVGHNDEIRLDGRPVRRHAVATGAAFIANRSPGEGLAEPDETGERDTLLERLPRKAGRRFVAVSPMPRIDGGLELLTSDGDLAARLQRATRGLVCEFSVRVRGELREDQLAGVRGGELDRGQVLEVLGIEPGGGEASNRWYVIEARGASGKDVRQLFERQGAIVSRVLRVRFGELELERSLPRGKWRRLLPAEIDKLLGVEPADAREVKRGGHAPAKRANRDDRHPGAKHGDTRPGAKRDTRTGGDRRHGKPGDGRRGKSSGRRY
jgi:23S rRNA pseudouridine2605 synthase